MILVAVIVAGAVGGVIVPPILLSSNGQAVGSGYLAATQTGLFFIQWTQTGNRLSGTAHIIHAKGTAPTESVTSRTIRVTGRVNGSTIVLSFTGGNDQFGKLTGQSFTINFPDQSGGLSPVTFRESSVAAYDRTIGAIKGRVANADTTARNEQRLRAAEAAVTRAANALQSTLTAIKTAETRLPGLVATVRTALSRATGALAQTRAAAAIAAATTTKTNRCTAADTVRTDADTVRTDADEVRTSAGDVARALSTTSPTGLRQLMGRIAPDVTQLHNAEGAVPQYQPPGVPTQTTIQQALKAATSDGSAAVATVNGMIAAANSDMATAFAIAAQALAQRSCGGVSSPTPIASISR